MIILTIKITQQVKGIKILQHAVGANATNMEKHASDDIFEAVTQCCIKAGKGGGVFIAEGKGSDEVMDRIIKKKTERR